jgi:hypothetical protein
VDGKVWQSVTNVNCHDKEHNGRWSDETTIGKKGINRMRAVINSSVLLGFAGFARFTHARLSTGTLLTARLMREIPNSMGDGFFGYRGEISRGKTLSCAVLMNAREESEFFRRTETEKNSRN